MQKDAEAWDRLVALYAPLVMYWLRRWDLRDEDASDVFQEVFKAVAINLESFRKDREGDTLRGWLRTIARNKTADHFRKLRGVPRGEGGTAAFVRLEQMPARSLVDPSADDPTDRDVDNDAQGRAAQDSLVHRALEQVRPHIQETTWRAFWRVVVDGQPATDVGQELGMTPGAVRVAKCRVLQRLREELGDVIE